MRSAAPRPPSPTARGRILPVVLFLVLALLVGLGRSIGEDPPPVRDQLTREVALDIPSARQRALDRGGDVFPFRWKIGGFLGLLAGLFVPNSGDALMTITVNEEDRTVIEVLITAPNREGEHFLYGSEIDRATGATSSVWSSQSFRGKRKDKEQEIRDPTVISYATAILRLRWNPPESPIRIRVWNDGKIYPADVEPIAPHPRKISGHEIEVRGYGIRGAIVDGKPSFDDKMFLYFALDEAATPVEILGKRSILKVRVQLVDEETLTKLVID